LNELYDVTRQELYDALSLTFTDGIQPHGFDLEVLSRGEPNDFGVLAGAALIQGRPVRVRKNLRYSTQAWTDPKRAARDGVAVIPPLTTPTGPAEGVPPRLDVVYLDVWDREVMSDEDANLINPAIGVETCTRLKREAAVRVAGLASMMPAYCDVDGVPCHASADLLTSILRDAWGGFPICKARCGSITRTTATGSPPSATGR